MNIDISKGIEVGGFHYTIELTGDGHKDLEAEHNWGDCNYIFRRIRTRTGLSDDQLRSTFIHEVIEAVNEEYCNRKIKHDEITNLANGLAQVFKSLGINFVYEE